MPPMSLTEQKRRGTIGRSGGGGGGLSRVFQNLGGGAKTTEENTEIPQDILDMLGQEGPAYSNSKGKMVSTPYSDTRSVFSRMMGAPNKAEDLNLGLSSMEKEGTLKNKIGMDWLTKSGPIQARNELALKLGVPVEVIDQLSPSLLEGAKASVSASTAKNKRSAEEDITGEQKAKATRNLDIDTAKHKATFERNRSTSQATASFGQPFRKVVSDATIAQEGLPIAALQRALTQNLGPGDTSIFNPSLTLGAGLADALQPILGSGFTGRGTMTERTPQMMNIGGKSYPTGDMLMHQTPGSITPNTNMKEIQNFLQQQMQTPGTIPTAPSEDSGLLDRSMRGRSSGGLSAFQKESLPSEMISARPEEESFMQLLRRLFSGPLMGGMR